MILARDRLLGQRLPVVIGVSFAALLVALLAVGMQRASQLQSASVALQLAAGLRAQPQALGAELSLVQRGLEARTFVDDSVDQIARSREAFTEALAEIDRNLEATGFGTQGDLVAKREELGRAWASFEPRLDALLEIQGNPYVDRAGASTLSRDGRLLRDRVNDSLAAHPGAARELGSALEGLGSTLREAVDSRGRSLRTYLLVAAAVSASLLALMLFFAARSRHAGAAADRAERQVADILATVHEGLFLLDRQLCLGSVYSQSLSRILRSEVQPGASFESLLRPIVPERSLRTALRFVNLLWKESVHEELIDSVNPLGQVEVRFPRPSGGEDVRYLSFGFRRVRGGEDQREFLLGTVTDNSARVQIAQELERTKAENQAQVELMLQLLQVPAASLETFVGESQESLARINGILKQSGHGQSELQAKLKTVFREVHTLKGEAGALGIASIATRLHALEETLVQMRERTSLDGNDFIPIVVALDGIMSHLNGVGRFSQRLSAVRPEPTTSKEGLDDATVDGILEASEPVRGVLGQRAASMAVAGSESLESGAGRVVSEVAAAEGKVVRFRGRGLDLLPVETRKAAKDILTHLLRNAVVHGIESELERKRANKPLVATIEVSFVPDGEQGCLLQVEDDGRGIAYERVLDRALRQGIVSPAEAAGMERTKVLALIFRAGFSTLEHATEHAGRGVGLDVVSHRIRELEGSIGVSTVEGKGTRFQLRWPRSGAVPATGEGSPG